MTRGSAAARRLLARAFGSVRVRVAALVFLAAVPLLLLSATIAVQNYRLALDASAESASRLRESALVRHGSAISSVERVLQALARAPDIAAPVPDRCADRLGDALSIQPSRYSNIALLTVDGSIICAARLPSRSPRAAEVAALNRAAFAAPAAKQGLTLGPMRESLFSDNGLVIPAAYPVRRDGKVAAYLLAGLRVDWFSKRAIPGVSEPPSVWIADSTGRLAQVAAAAPAGLPSETVLARLLSGSTIVDAESSGGAPYAYASAPLGYGYRLLVAYPASSDQAAAEHLLTRRIVQLAFLLMLGLTAIAIGTHWALVEPLHQLRRAVAGWQLHGQFDPASLRTAPTELRELAEAFAAATAALADHAAKHMVAVEQQELLIKEIHHRVKNNLQIVASLLNLQASRIRLPEARAEFASARDRVRALATLHRHLYAEGEVHTINMRSFLTELCDQLFQAMGEVEGERITLHIDASALQMSSDQAVPVSLIVTEAVTNALKYAFPAGRRGHVTVILRAEGEDATLSIDDDGVGMNQGQTDTETGQRDGIGIVLIRGFARQLGATLIVGHERGTSYVLTMKLRREAETAELA